ncbi:hypothetical protein A2V82_11010 [candidate division KSB1 bacterium RBG_16_48_16]|nr:MAG: hypothetical protein A2V82_11010 [candidate division KSB1 bacterium RBG_16_48_16]
MLAWTAEKFSRFGFRTPGGIQIITQPGQARTKKLNRNLCHCNFMIFETYFQHLNILPEMSKIFLLSY